MLCRLYNISHFIGQISKLSVLPILYVYTQSVVLPDVRSYFVELTDLLGNCLISFIINNEHVANFSAIYRASPCQASMTVAPSPTTSASPPRRAALTNRAGQTSSVPQTGECSHQSPHGDKGYQPFSMSHRCFQKSNWFPLMTVLCKWLLLGLFITGGNFSVSSLCHKILEIFPPDDF